MITNVVEGDLLRMFSARKFHGIAHGCNCLHAMRSGIAGQITKIFPEAQHADNLTAPDTGKLGTYSMAQIEDSYGPLGVIFNLYTQRRPGQETQEFLGAGLYAAFTRLNSFLKGAAGYKLGIPQIGAGIAGGDWAIHERIINEVTPNLDITLVNWKP